MKQHFIVAGLLVFLALSGCTDKHISTVKATTFGDFVPSNLTIDRTLTTGQVLDHRKICASIQWSTLTTDRSQTVVQYTCTYRGLKDSLVYKKQLAKGIKPAYLASDISDVYQWTFDSTDRPILTYVANVAHYPPGGIRDSFESNRDNPQLLRMATEDTVTNYHDEGIFFYGPCGDGGVCQ